MELTEIAVAELVAAARLMAALAPQGLGTPASGSPASQVGSALSQLLTCRQACRHSHLDFHAVVSGAFVPGGRVDARTGGDLGATRLAELHRLARDLLRVLEDLGAPG